MRLTRVYRFSASHRLHSDRLGDEENRELYGKCNNPYGHGHDYVVHVSVEGAPGESGRVVAPGDLDALVKERILDVFDHRDLNTDVEGFRGVTTTENLALEVHRRLREAWPAALEARIARVWIQETPRNTFESR